jgi:hypothetical protein
MAFAAAAMLSGPMMATPTDTLAANQKQGDGLVNVQVGDITLQNIAITAAVPIVASVCPAVAADVDAFVLAAQNVDATGQKQTVDCTTAGDQDVLIKQNSQKG